MWVVLKQNRVRMICLDSVFSLPLCLRDLHHQPSARRQRQPFHARTATSKALQINRGSNMEGSSRSTGQARQSSVTSLTDLASASSGGQPPAAGIASASGGGAGGAANAGAATATLTITEEETQDVPQEQILRLSLAPRPRVTWCV